MTTRTETYGLLGTLSPKMAQDLGEAFSLQQIGVSSASRPRRDSDSKSRAALRFATRAAVFVSVTAIAVLLAASALFLIQV